MKWLLLIFMIVPLHAQTLEDRVATLENLVRQLRLEASICSTRQVIIPELIPVPERPRTPNRPPPLREFADTRWRFSLGMQNSSAHGLGPVAGIEYRINHHYAFQFTNTPSATTAQININLGGSPVHH